LQLLIADSMEKAKLHCPKANLVASVAVRKPFILLDRHANGKR